MQQQARPTTFFFGCVYVGTHSPATTSRIHNNILWLRKWWLLVVLRPAVVQQQTEVTIIYFAYVYGSRVWFWDMRACNKKQNYNNILCLCLCWPRVVRRHTVVQQQAEFTISYFDYVYVGRVCGLEAHSGATTRKTHNNLLCLCSRKVVSATWVLRGLARFPFHGSCVHKPD